MHGWPLVERENNYCVIFLAQRSVEMLFRCVVIVQSEYRRIRCKSCVDFSLWYMFVHGKISVLFF